MLYYNTVYLLDGSCDLDMSLGKGCPDVPSVDIPNNFISMLGSLLYSIFTCRSMWFEITRQRLSR